MNKKGIVAFLILAASVTWAPAGVAQETDCRAIYNTSSQMTGAAPGSLSTARDTPCILSRNIGATRGRPPGRAGGITIVEPPKNGTVRVIDRSSLLFTPKPGFTGSDTMLARMGYAGGKSGLVRFAISVY